MEDERPDGDGVETDLTQVLRHVQAGLERAGATITSMLGTLVADNAELLSELEAALSDAEAALLPD